MRPCLLLLAALAAPAAAQTFTAAPERFPVDPAYAIGPAVVDVDGNGRVDLVTARWLFLQRADGFEARPVDLNSVLGVIAGDADGDGVRELALLAVNRPKLVAYDPVADVLGPPQELPIAAAEFPLVQGSVWLDDDRDGHLDLLIGNDGPPDVLLRGAGDGTFADVSAAVLPAVDGGTYGMAAADYDRDGDLDVAIGLCYPLPASNLLYRRGPDGFAEVGVAAGAADPLASWGVAWLDYDGDGWLDLYTANMASSADGVGWPATNSLRRNRGNGTFEEVAVAAGVAGDDDSWNVAAADFDNDGHIDLFVANAPQDSRLYRNRGDGTFEDATAAAGLAGLADTGLAVGDVDGDGWVDVFMPSQPGRLYLNDGGANHWLAVQLRGTDSNADGIGARVEVTAGGRTRVREITAGDGMMAHSHALEAHVGLGAETTADVTVRWPSGAVTTVAGVAADQRVTIVEGEGLNAPPGLFTLDAVAGASLGTPITLAWSPAADTDVVSYDVTLRHASGAERTWTTTATSVAFTEATVGGDYRWSVRATDGRSVRLADAPGAFVVAPVAGEADPGRAGLAVAVGPNPAAGRLAVRVEGLRGRAEVEVLDLLGRRVAARPIVAGPDGRDSATFDLAGVPAGAYVVRVTSASAAASVRVVVAE